VLRKNLNNLKVSYIMPANGQGAREAPWCRAADVLGTHGADEFGTSEEMRRAFVAAVFRPPSVIAAPPKAH